MSLTWMPLAIRHTSKTKFTGRRQAEVAHHANRCPQYFCSRPQKQIHLYKKALALPTGTKKKSNQDTDGWEDEDWAVREDTRQGLN